MANVKDLLVNGSARVIGTIYGNATSANKLNTNAGSTSQPIYFSNGVPVAITGTLGNNISGNAATATKLATARTISLTGSVTGSGSFDGSGNLSISTTTNHTHNYAGSASAGGSANSANLLNGSMSGVTFPTADIGAGTLKYYYNVNLGVAGNMPASSNANSIIQLSKHGGDFNSQLGFSSNGNIYYRNFHGAAIDTTTAWKQIAFTDTKVNSAVTADSASAVSWNNITGKPSTFAPSSHNHDDRYVLKTGDTMTGTLFINKAGNIGSSPLIVGGTSTAIHPSVSSMTTMLQLVAGTGGETNSTGIGFHNPNVSSASFGYYNTDANNGQFKFLSDDTYWDVAIGGTKKLASSWGTSNLIIGADGNDKIVAGYLASSTSGLVIGGHNSALSDWSPINLSGTTIYFRCRETINGKFDTNGALSLYPRGGNYNEGIRIHASGSWSDLLLCGSDNSSDTGTSANSWFFGNNNGNLYISRSDWASASSYISNVNNHWILSPNVSINGFLTTNSVRGGMWITGTHECTYFSSSATPASAGQYYQGHYGLKTPNGAWSLGILSGSNHLYFVYGTDANYSSGNNNSNTTVHISESGGIYGAVWNDYAEYRKSTELEPGRCVIEVGDGSLIRSFGRLEPGAEIVSDTFGFAIGETDECKTPLAVSGRVLAYPAEDRESYKPGDAVCSGPNGTVSKMTRQEIREWPDRIIGTVSEIPNYETWGTGNVSVNGRIWIRIR